MSLTELQDQSAASAAEGVTAADTPAVETSGEKSLVDAVLTALDPAEGSPASPDEPGAEAAKAADANGTDKGTEEAKAEPETESGFTEEEMARLSGKTRERIGSLLEQRKAEFDRAEAATAELNKFKPMAENYERIQGFMKDNGVAPKDAGEALRLAGLINTDPIAAFEALRPVYAKLAQMAGAVLPQDLAEAVRLGQITEAAAFELSRNRAKVAIGDRRTQVQREQSEKQQRAAEATEHVHLLSTVGDRLAAERASADPDWNLKEPLVVDKLKAGIAVKGLPKDEAELVSRFNTAVSEVTTYLRQVQPRTAPVTKPVESKSAPSSVQYTSPPKDVTEAVLRALG